ncbi:MAG: sterol desaturase family protein [Ilumatobacteraceae bacterium]
MTLPRTILSWSIDHSVTMLLVWVVGAVVAERVITRMQRRRLDDGAGTSIVAGIGYIAAKAVVSELVMFAVAMWVYDHHRLFELDPLDPRVWLGVFVGRDLVYYWIHRAEHRMSALWASHMIHHSSERFTFTTAVRMPWMEAVYKPLLGLWVPLLGFHPIAFAAMGAFVLMAGQLQHTEWLPGRRRIDRWIVTPSVHRVHHGSNARYLDKNFGSMLTVWDRCFGTYEPESEPVRYGLTGDKVVSTPGAALVGGYPALLSRVMSETGWLPRLRVAVGAP